MPAVESVVPVEVLDTYLPPFVVLHDRVFDANSHTVASVFGSNDEYPIPRGYGIFGQMPNGDDIHRRWCDAYYALVGRTATCEQAVDALNAEWARTGFPLSREERHLRGMKKK